MNSSKWQLPIDSLEETQRLAAYIGSQSWPGLVIALDGDLGAGKTTFSKALAAAIGVKEVVSSPTFTIIKEYEGNLPFYHMDVYRLSLEEADELGLDDYFYGHGVTVVEWASLIEELMPEQFLAIRLEYIDEQQRMVHMEAFGERYEQLLQYIQDWSLT
ncbi:tRNA (adenosine(37)-N6)-threonylcarbamoyltransferase complex ATPase subunit type 1 TsaE [Paenibacillus camelliae]|uniref:tRNA (adenosine(37)-N6)-threonylcarbamoyltransferase complex ATPase subunit type 1 TsaE n=1 Tax=Paenibacillus camelliae TaxID=512410 RepID=UPI00204230D8|nr:tRNA (adenosine(37)-N6)-threonylcarbamoyltransferase complex ATPase subunit type 1 TsaE [Paenibacillus camelliae]MCM3633814.1 tRNA (adenosine(37)-N6)-threonylcarbamoyltransferase complex ATPase subunit type 1 TsaE [Paenibacillus camelliae]